MTQLSFSSHNTITVDYSVAPADVCGGVWSDENQQFVPVAPSSPYFDQQFGHTLVEYADVEGEVRACLLSVPAGGISPTWEIDVDAGNGRYYEVQQTVAGQGTFNHWLPDGGDAPRNYSVPLPESPTEPLGVYPGEAFSVAAAHNTGVHVLALFCGAPFQLAFERRVELELV